MRILRQFLVELLREHVIACESCGMPVSDVPGDFIREFPTHAIHFCNAHCAPKEPRMVWTEQQ